MGLFCLKDYKIYSSAKILWNQSEEGLSAS